MEDIKKYLIEFAAQVGFCLIGFAKSEKIEDNVEHYREWLAKDYHSGMKYMEKYQDLRIDPAELHPGTKTVIMVAMSYNNHFSHPTEYNKEQFGKISRYAWGKDYHIVIKKKLKALSNKLIELNPRAVNRYFVDTGPIPEKYWAEKAGIGWQGKNSLIINKKYGSFIFLGTLLTNIEFSPDKPAENHCGDCELCINSCPTGAIVRDKLIDAGKCISYNTVEKQAGRRMPEDISKKINGWAYGCDDCQNICPWNEKALKVQNDDFYPKDNETILEFRKILNINEEEFQARFSQSPVKRLKLAGLAENIEDILRAGSHLP